jgi:hypothetical protein
MHSWQSRCFGARVRPSSGPGHVYSPEAFGELMKQELALDTVGHKG